MWSRDGSADALAGELDGGAGGDPLVDQFAQPIETSCAKERLVEVEDHVGDVDIGPVIEPDDGLLGPGRADAHEVHALSIRWATLVFRGQVFSRSGRRAGWFVTTPR